MSSYEPVAVPYFDCWVASLIGQHLRRGMFRAGVVNALSAFVGGNDMIFGGQEIEAIRDHSRSP